MPMKTLPEWSAEYEAQHQDSFSKAGEVDGGGNPIYDEDGMYQLAKEAWGKWIENSTAGIQCIAPLAAPVTLTGATPGFTGFAPDFKNKSGVADVAAELVNQFTAYAGAIVFTPPPPGPPFSAISAVTIDSAAAAGALLSGLMLELTITPPPGGEQVKYDALATLFRTAMSSLQVHFIGFGMGSPPPPLDIPVPVF